MKTIVIIKDQGTHVIEDGSKLTVAQAMKDLGLKWREYKVADTTETKTRITYTVEAKTPKAPKGCEKCGQSFAVHNDDGSCIDDTIPEPEFIPAPAVEVAKVERLTITDALTGVVVSGPPEEPKEPEIPKTVTIQRKEFEAALKTALSVVPKKPSMPILAYIHITNTAGQLSIIVNDLEKTWTRRLVATGDDIDLAVPLAILQKEVAALSDDLVDVILTATGNNLSVNSRATIHMADVSDFPEPRVKEIPDDAVKVTVDDLAVKIKKIYPAISVDETRFILNNAYLDFRDGKVVGTDGFRMHLENIPVYDVDPVLIPRQVVELIKQYGASDAFSLHGEYVSFHVGGGVLTTQIVSGTFPDYKSVYPKDLINGLTFSSAQFLQIMKGAKPLADSKSITLEGNGDLTIQAASEAGTYQWKIPCTTAGKPPVLSYNLEFLVAAITAYSGDTVELKCSAEYGATIINENAIVMPTRR